MFNPRFFDLQKAMEQRIGLLMLALSQNLLASGLIYGWAALSVLLINIGAFSWECQDQTPCEEQRQHLHLVYTFAQSANLFGSLVSGIILDQFGPRVCSIISMTGVSAGVLIMGLAAEYQTKNTIDGYMAALILMGFSGPGVQVALFHISNLFPGHTGSIAVLISGSFQMSFVVFLVFKSLNSSFDNLSFQMICYCYAALLGVLSCFSVTVWPDKPISVQISGIVNEEREHESSTTTAIPQEKYQFLRLVGQSMYTTKFMLLAYWMVMCVFWANYYIGTISDQLFAYYGESESLSYVNQFNLLLMCGTALIPFFGAFLDRMGFGYAFLITNLFGVLFAIGSSFKILHLQIFTFIMYSCFRTFVFCSVFAYIGAEFGYNLFGSISGILFLLASLVSLFQYWLVRIVDAHYETLNSFMLLFIASTTVFPIYVISHERNQRMLYSYAELSDADPNNHDSPPITP